MSHVERDFAARIREHGYRYTPQRQLILDTLCGLGRHATVDEIYGRIQEVAPTISLATVYRTVNFLEEMNLVDSAEIQGDTVYEIAPERPHHHLICCRCGGVITLTGDDFRDLICHLEEAYGFQAEIRHLTLSGICADCRR